MLQKGCVDGVHLFLLKLKLRADWKEHKLEACSQILKACIKIQPVGGIHTVGSWWPMVGDWPNSGRGHSNNPSKGDCVNLHGIKIQKNVLVYQLDSPLAGCIEPLQLGRVLI